MNEKQRQETEKTGPRKVKVTDRRRVSPEGDVAGDADAVREEPRVDVSRGSETSEASRRSEAPPASGEPSATGEASRRSETTPAEGEPRALDEAAQLREHLQRMAADFDNYRKRVLKEQTRAVEMAAEPLIRRLLEVLDEFDLALIAAEQKPDFDKFLHGVELVYAKLLETLHAEGLEKIAADGKPFDPSLHEALMQSGDTDGDPFVADVLRPGYTLRGRVIRPAGVKVVRK